MNELKDNKEKNILNSSNLQFVFDLEERGKQTKGTKYRFLAFKYYQEV